MARATIFDDGSGKLGGMAAGLGGARVSIMPAVPLGGDVPAHGSSSSHRRESRESAGAQGSPGRDRPPPPRRRKGGSSKSGLCDAAAVAFDGLRTQLEQRKAAQFDDFAHKLEGIDAGLFAEQAGDRCSSARGRLELSVSGALPPTTPFRGVIDVSNSVTIRRGERQAASEIMARRAASEREAILKAAGDVRSDDQRTIETRRAQVSLPPVTCTPRSSAAPMQAEDSKNSPSMCQATSDADPLAESSWLSGSTYLSDDSEDDYDDECVTPSVEDLAQDLDLEIHGVGTQDVRILEDNIYEQNAPVEHEDDKVQARQVISDIRRDRRAKVDKSHFAREHRKREAAISKSSHRKQVQDSFNAYKSEMHVSLLSNFEHEQARKEEVRARIQAVREKKRAVREVSASQRDFLLRHSTLEKTVRTMDLRAHAADQIRATVEHVEARQEQGCQRAKHLLARRTLCEAQSQVLAAQERDRITRVEIQAKHRDEEELGRRRQRIHEKRALDQLLRTAREELGSASKLRPRTAGGGQSRRVDPDASSAGRPKTGAGAFMSQAGSVCPASADAERQAYEATLADIWELAEQVRNQSARLNTNASYSTTSLWAPSTSQRLVRSHQQSLQSVQSASQQSAQPALREDHLHGVPPAASRRDDVDGDILEEDRSDVARLQAPRQVSGGLPSIFPRGEREHPSPTSSQGQSSVHFYDELVDSLDASGTEVASASAPVGPPSGGLPGAGSGGSYGRR